MGDVRILRPADLPPEDLERESLDASEPVCDHRGVVRFTTEQCDCGAELFTRSEWVPR